jgi:hypothetical protein
VHLQALDRDRITGAVRELLHGVGQSEQAEVLRASARSLKGPREEV